MSDRNKHVGLCEQNYNATKTLCAFPENTVYYKQNQEQNGKSEYISLNGITDKTPNKTNQ